MKKSKINFGGGICPGGNCPKNGGGRCHKKGGGRCHKIGGGKCPDGICIIFANIKRVISLLLIEFY